uniref:Uncharacterized protein n=1 Tax=Arundo donax TaxID=35708 RepID=A0A0A9DZZ4_ARUDO
MAGTGVVIGQQAEAGNEDAVHAKEVGPYRGARPKKPSVRVFGLDWANALKACKRACDACYITWLGRQEGNQLVTNYYYLIYQFLCSSSFRFFSFPPILLLLPPILL